MTREANMLTKPNLLSRLDGVRHAGEKQWKACCPAHDDRHPSLSIRETHDGTLLVKCWAGCSAKEIVAAIGLELRDLFPNSMPPLRNMPSREAIQFERMIVQLGSPHVAPGNLSESDLARLELAVLRLKSIGAEND